MRKLLHVSLFVLPFVFSGCYFTINGTMCDQIRTDPNAVVPQECRTYNEKDAEKASVINHEINGSDIIKFVPKEN
jgi:urea transporter